MHWRRTTPQKMIWFISIYPTDTTAHSIPVHDNQDVKRVIDIITDYTLGGDSAPGCSLRQDTQLRDDIASGTYILVMPLVDQCLTICEAVDYIRLSIERTHKKAT